MKGSNIKKKKNTSVFKSLMNLSFGKEHKMHLVTLLENICCNQLIISASQQTCDIIEWASWYIVRGVQHGMAVAISDSDKKNDVSKSHYDVTSWCQVGS